MAATRATATGCTTSSPRPWRSRAGGGVHKRGTGGAPMRFIMMVAIVLVVAGLGAIVFRPRIARAAMLSVGATAPDFHSQVVHGDQVTPISLADFHGHKLVLYFYPKDNTPGCTNEACAFRDGYARLQAAAIWVLGCSID